MKSSIIWILVGLILLGVTFWFLTQDLATPTSDTTQPVVGPVVEDYIGLTEAEAEILAVNNATPFRVVERDGEPQMVTEDYVPGRINATVDAGVVVAYAIEGFDLDMNEDIAIDGMHDSIIGMTVAEAEVYAVENDVMFRIGFRDGEPLGVTMDYRIGRITAQVENGIVTGYTVE